MENRMSLIVFSGTADKLMAVATLTSGAVAMGLEVELFLTTWGLQAFRKGAAQATVSVSKDAGDLGPVLLEQMRKKQVPGWLETLQQARELGQVHVYACAMTLELLDMKLEDLEPIVEEVVGVASFIERASESRITLFI
ncbi:MAG: DsrE/DsrF/DrsH-like family protein [Thermogemmatispora sp.]|jgi:peroxiredoxin family protein|uniref:Peroxiredoxin n=1 Tax=Thermogemmatispora tikiterensis TaxID=1825093 RepID=A0A328VEI6_9CHLR|nr:MULTISPECIES: DsrE/DsrF/DrsH-like family protein [Thermogemmatispora]MBE3567350.1 DsrE/DsrF/DrsH-like family protein [Thermogemmatispora sp.]RAQ94180.1 peroxiredoxin [Thermogemmatispora tikiterensis]